jgi:hypothetical protein
MSAVLHRAAARPRSHRAKPRIWQAVGRALSWLDGSKNDPYSPLVCISMLLLAGLLVKIAPAFPAYLAQN